MESSTRSFIRLFRATPRAAFAGCLVLGQAMFIAGCGGGSAAVSNASVTAEAAPVILSLPSDQSVPMGLTATYLITATGSDLQFQWKKNGTAIAGATSNSYTTPATTFADSGASFSVTVSNLGHSFDSPAAALTVTARAPMAGDLRFEQVDAASTVNGWGGTLGLDTALLSRFDTYYGPALGTPFWVGSSVNCPVPAVTDGTGCAWNYSVSQPAAYGGSASFTMGYGSDVYANFQDDLQNSQWPFIRNGGPAVTPFFDGSVVTSLDLDSTSAVFAVSWIQSPQASGFVAERAAVAPVALQAAAAQEGAAGRVITAISYDAGQVTYIAYGWQADAGTQYESQVVTTSTPGAVAAAASLAAQGYIITASGRADDAGNVLLVGTRVQGDTMARPFAAGDGSALQAWAQKGYSVVAVIFDTTQTDATTFVLER